MPRGRAQQKGANMNANGSNARVLVSAVVLSLAAFSSLGCDNLFGLDRVEPVDSGSPDPADVPNFYSCNCACKGGAVNVNRKVCLPPSLNPLLPGSTADAGVTPTAVELTADCTGRVQNNVEQLGKTCIANSFKCSCAAVADLSYAQECNVVLPAEDLAANCSNFSPATHVKTATNVPGQPPVFFIASSDPPTPTPDSLASGLFGRESLCNVSGTLTVARGDESGTSDAAGFVVIQGDPCTTAGCKLGMSYRFDDVHSMSFDGFSAFDSVVFSSIRAGGATLPEAATLDGLGKASFAAATTLSSGRGRRSNEVLGVEVSSETAAYVGSNGAPIDLFPNFASHSCRLVGSILGSVEESDTTISFDVAGTIVNEPPTANIGTGMAAVECTSSSGATVTLDATGSTDPESNITLYAWRTGSRTGPDVSESASFTRSQALWTPVVYYLTVVDGYGQASFASKLVNVVDTKAPTIWSATASPNVLKPADHKMVAVTVTAIASDTCSAATCKITGVTSNQPVEGVGSGNTAPDWQITGDLTVNLRRERSPMNEPRTYTLAIACKDASDNTATTSVSVTVPLR